MKTNKEMFEELTFIPHRAAHNGVAARKNFDNGYTISVVSGDGLYGDIDESDFHNSTFEVAAFDGKGEFVKLTLHDDVIGHQTLEEVSQIMVRLQDDPESLRVDGQRCL